MRTLSVCRAEQVWGPAPRGRLLPYARSGELGPGSDVVAQTPTSAASTLVSTPGRIGIGTVPRAQPVPSALGTPLAAKRGPGWGKNRPSQRPIPLFLEARPTPPTFR